MGLEGAWVLRGSLVAYPGSFLLWLGVDYLTLVELSPLKDELSGGSCGYSRDVNENTSIAMNIGKASISLSTPVPLCLWLTHSISPGKVLDVNYPRVGECCFYQCRARATTKVGNCTGT